jgi:hypothetical protein
MKHMKSKLLVGSTIALLIVACNAPRTQPVTSDPASTTPSNPPSTAVTAATAGSSSAPDPARIETAFAERLRDMRSKYDGAVDGRLPPDSQRELADTCTSLGGVIQMNHITQHIYCSARMTDAGKACHTSKECAGYCRAPSTAKSGDRVDGQCSPEKNLDDCANVIDERGVVQMLCVN